MGERDRERGKKKATCGERMNDESGIELSAISFYNLSAVTCSPPLFPFRGLLVEMTNRSNRWCMLCVASMLALAGCGGDVPTKQKARVQHTGQQRGEIARGKVHFIDDYHLGLEMAQQQGIPLMLFFTADWCKFCHQMAEEALSQDHVAQLSERFVCVLIDNGSQAALCRDFRVRSYPTLLFLSPRGVPLNRVTGKQPSHIVMMEMQSALQAVARHAQAGEEVVR